MSNLDLYSFITIALISVGGFASLAIWYWLEEDLSGRSGPLFTPSMENQPFRL